MILADILLRVEIGRSSVVLQLLETCLSMRIRSAPKGIWFNLRIADPAEHKVAITYQRHYRKLIEAEMDTKFLLRCRDESVYPTNVKWKILKKMKPKDRTRYHERNLKQSIADTHTKLRNLRKDNEQMDLNLRSSG